VERGYDFPPFGADGGYAVSFLEKFLRQCENVMTFLAIGATFILMCLTTADAMGRYLFNWPIIWAYEITESYLMVAAVFFGICYAYRGGGLIRVTFMTTRFPRQMQTILNYAVQIFCTLLGSLILIATLYQAQSTLASGKTLDVLPIPVGPAYVIVAVGLFSMTLVLGIDLWRVRSGKSDLFKDDSTGV
jgi:TRAP-type C4-dicarboxylate transport system permease small subunit